MSKDPAFLFYPGDYLRDTQCLSEPAQVAYDRIMCEHMRNICISQEQLNFFTKRLTDDQKHELLMVLKKVDGGFQIDWVAESIEKRRNYSNSRRENRKGKPKTNSNISKSYVSHMEIENEIVNESIDTVKKELFADEIWMGTIKMTHKGKNLDQAWNECYLHHSSGPRPPQMLWEWKQKFNTWLTIKNADEKKSKFISKPKI